MRLNFAFFFQATLLLRSVGGWLNWREWNPIQPACRITLPVIPARTLRSSYFWHERRHIPILYNKWRERKKKKKKQKKPTFGGFPVCFVLWAIKCPGRFVPSPHNIKSEINMSECNWLKAKCTVRTHYSSIIIYM